MTEMRNPGAGQATGAHEIHAADRDHDTANTLALLAAVAGSPCATIRAVLRFCRPCDVALLDAPTSTALALAEEMAHAGQRPGPIELNAELLRRGLYDGHYGELVKCRVLDAATHKTAYPERVGKYAEAVLGQVYRARISACGEALTAGAATSPEADLWMLLEREGRAIRVIRDSLAALRKHCGKREEVENV
ncbi:hypothetical protein [Gordonia sp. FQ]|uniref:hypothetical protein n=1 Tax=Gordonia sp. FQ TaxID=3446634 RepID=UPI003F83DE9C